MRERTFVVRHEPTWDALETLLTDVERRGVKKLPPEDLRRLALLYRTTTGDLAAAQSRAYGEDLRAYLNRLTARAHSYVYGATAKAGWHRIVEMFAVTFPREFRRSGRIIGAVSAMFVIATVLAYVITIARPASAYALLPAGSIPSISKSLHDSNFAFDSRFAPLMSSEIITNNIRVAAIAFAGGMTLGILTVWSIVNNGLMLGGLGALFTLKGFGPDFWATVAPHGVIELTSIQIAGGAGMLIAKSIIAPGRKRRVDALREGARRAGVLMIGVIGLLLVAGTIEGFFSPLRTSIPMRESVGALTAIALTAYFWRAGRRGAAQDLRE